jgi:hypothetical protein
MSDTLFAMFFFMEEMCTRFMVFAICLLGFGFLMIPLLGKVGWEGGNECKDGVRWLVDCSW